MMDHDHGDEDPGAYEELRFLPVTRPENSGQHAHRYANGYPFGHGLGAWSTTPQIAELARAAPDPTMLCEPVRVDFGCVWPDGRVHYSHVEVAGERTLHKIEDLPRDTFRAGYDVEQRPMRIEHLAITPRGLELGGFVSQYNQKPVELDDPADYRAWQTEQLERRPEDRTPWRAAVERDANAPAYGGPALLVNDASSMAANRITHVEVVAPNVRRIRIGPPIEVTQEDIDEHEERFSRPCYRSPHCKGSPRCRQLDPCTPCAAGLDSHELCAEVVRNPGDGAHCLLPKGHDGPHESVPRKGSL